MSVSRLKVPSDAVRREFAVYVMVARSKRTEKTKLYVGKTGDNREGCNPIVSRAGNHFSFNVKHSQMRNLLRRPEQYDFEFFYTTFGAYTKGEKERRKRVDTINEMERQLNRLVQGTFPSGVLMNPYKGSAHVRKEERQKRKSLATKERMGRLNELVSRVREALRRKGRERV